MGQRKGYKPSAEHKLNISIAVKKSWTPERRKRWGAKISALSSQSKLTIAEKLAIIEAELGEPKPEREATLGEQQ